MFGQVDSTLGFVHLFPAACAFRVAPSYFRCAGNATDVSITFVVQRVIWQIMCMDFIPNLISRPVYQGINFNNNAVNEKKACWPKPSS